MIRREVFPTLDWTITTHICIIHCLLNERHLRCQDLNDGPSIHQPDSLRTKAKAKAKQILRFSHDDSSSEEHGEDQFFDAVVDEINESAASDADTILNTFRLGSGSRFERTKDILRGTADAIAHPVESIKSKATRKAAAKLAKSRPYLSNQANLDFLKAHDDLPCNLQ